MVNGLLISSSLQVPLGVKLKNEAKNDVMVDLHKYVPTRRSTSSITLNGNQHTVTKEQIYPICLGGDQMSVAMYRGSSVICWNSTTPTKRLEGLFAVCEDCQVYSLKTLFYLFYPKKTEHFLYVYEEYPVSADMF